MTKKISISFSCVILVFLILSGFFKKMHKPFFQASQNQPYHLSVGAVLCNQKKEIACHYFKEIFGHKDIYILMRETMEDNETPLDTLHRGLKEEFGATAEPLAYVGALVGPLPDKKLSFEKTTLYIACKLISFDQNGRSTDDAESKSEILWMEPDKLIAIMQQQGIRFNHRADADESEMIKRALVYF